MTEAKLEFSHVLRIIILIFKCGIKAGLLSCLFTFFLGGLLAGKIVNYSDAFNLLSTDGQRLAFVVTSVVLAFLVSALYWLFSFRKAARQLLAGEFSIAVPDMATRLVDSALIYPVVLIVVVVCTLVFDGLLVKIFG